MKTCYINLNIKSIRILINNKEIHNVIKVRDRRNVDLKLLIYKIGKLY